MSRNWLRRDTDSRLGQLTDVVSNLAQEVGGLSRSISYALENEAYRQLPAYLEANYGIVLDKRLVRTEIEGEEVDLFALSQRNGTPIVLVGEAKLQLERRRSIRPYFLRKFSGFLLDNANRAGFYWAKSGRTA